jgi:ATP-dependent Clp protease ATP-binding subunit ClpA
VLDKATLRLGDNTNVNFERSLIFLTSNLGAREMLKTLRPDFGYERQAEPLGAEAAAKKLKKIGLQAVRRKFSPEFVNRLDAVVTYEPLSSDTLNDILNLQLADFQSHLRTRLGLRAFQVTATDAAREFLLTSGTSSEYGARELKRTIHKHLIQPIAALIVASEIEPGTNLIADINSTGDGIQFHEGDPPRRRRTEMRLTG